MYTLTDRNYLIMCKRPHTLTTGQQIACRNCNDCIKVRSNEWLARAMAEKETSKYCYSITLTYNDETQSSRDGSKFFRYSDIQLFLKKLREAAFERWNVRGAVRFISAGEIGSKGDQRCHWHIVLYSQVELLDLGIFKNPFSGKLITTYDEKITTTKRKKRLAWSMWPQGFITVQVPDQQGIAYALIYALKDQFNLKNSKGTMRQTRSENYAAGHFRMSKAPPIGGAWLDQKIDRLYQTLSVLPNLHLNVPSYSGYWYPSRVLRDKLLRAMVSINDLSIQQLGRSAPQWKTLLSTIDPESKDYEVLTNGEEREEQETDDAEFKRRFELRSKEYDQSRSNRDTRKRCGGISPCAACLRSLSDEQFDAVSKETARTVKDLIASEAFKHSQSDRTTKQVIDDNGRGSFELADRFYRKTTLQCQKWCALRSIASTQQAFK